MAMDSNYRFSYHLRLFALLIFVSWAMVACFIGYQYYREKHIKVESIDNMLQLNNSHILDVIDTQSAGIEELKRLDLPQKDLRITVLDLKGNILYDNAANGDAVKENHLSRPEIAAALKDGKGYTVQRYKGLGEMDPEQLWETTMNREHRSLIQVNVEDAAEAERRLTILMGDKAEPRKDYITEYAQFGMQAE